MKIFLIFPLMCVSPTCVCVCIYVLNGQSFGKKHSKLSYQITFGSLLKRGEMDCLIVNNVVHY